ncbi:hypothetical protein ACEPAH_6653 [Sanghuangporus vaninii]
MCGVERKMRWGWERWDGHERGGRRRGGSTPPARSLLPPSSSQPRQTASVGVLKAVPALVPILALVVGFVVASSSSSSALYTQHTAAYRADGQT